MKQVRRESQCKGMSSTELVTSMDNWDSILLEFSKELCTCFRSVPPRDSLSLEREGRWKHLSTDACPHWSRDVPWGIKRPAHPVGHTWV